ncbi:Ig-like domain-containing protein [Cohnella cellulosilytica]|uniref:Ig-like domain-containing protein n=1 Tax=Cohnella cellulosilytica TaxID=986710 RepID=A0ABW2F462_9BACL
MRKIVTGMLALLLVLGLPWTAWGAANLSTEQKFEELRQNGIFTGFSDGSSRLYDSMSREQLAAVLYRLLELPAGRTVPSYNDVLKTRWSFSEVEAVARAGLMNGTKTRTFSPTSNVTVEQLAVILTRSYGLSGPSSTPVTGRVSPWARGAVGLALDRKLIPQLSDYTVDATRGLLVEAAYEIYAEMRVKPLFVRSVEQLTNQSVRIQLFQWADPGDKTIDKSRFVVKDVYGNTRNVLQATVAQDGMSIVLWTDRQLGGVLHTVTIDGATWSYMSAQEDTTKPGIVSQPVKVAHKTYELIFSEPVEQKSATNSANYQLSGGLRITSVKLSQDGRTVTFTTSDQADGKNYQLTVRNVKDLAGNVMDTRGDLYLTGSNDNTKPKVAEVKIDVTTALISVKFSEKIDPKHAALTGHYTIDKGLSVVQATLDGDGRTVVLKTTPQRDATFYTLTVSGIPDLAGNVMDASTNWRFGGVANPLEQAVLQSAAAINKNTVELTFNRALSDADVGGVKLGGMTDNGAAVSMSDWSAFVQRKPGSDRAVTIQYRTKSSANPDLFRSGHVYTAKVSGVSALNAAGGADTAVFAGTLVDNAVPFVTQAIVLDGKTVKVLFSEPVKNVSASAFQLREVDRRERGIDYVEQENPGKIVSEAILKLDDELRSNRHYELTFRANSVTDAAGWNGWKTKEGDKAFAVRFNT